MKRPADLTLYFFNKQRIISRIILTTICIYIIGEFGKYNYVFSYKLQDSANSPI